MITGPKNFLDISYDELEALNLEAKSRVAEHHDPALLQEEYLRYLSDKKEIKAVTVCFSDLEGRLHMLDYDKKFLVSSYDNLTFDGSSVRGFSGVSESDLRLKIDWGSFRWLPADVFGPGKVLVFGLIHSNNNTTYVSDWRGRLSEMTNQMWETDKTIANVAVEIEGFLFKGINAEQQFRTDTGFEFVSTGGYYHPLPQDPLRQFIDRFAEAQRAMGFSNEKDHPEVAPSQFELNFSYCDALQSADQIQLYQLMARQIANGMGMTASFLPKPVPNVNGNGMHTNMSMARNGKNLFYSADGEDNLSDMAIGFVDRILNNANDLCLILNPSANSDRRLAPVYEAPNQIKSSAIDRTSMVRIPLGNEKSARIEVRSVSPDTNPYLLFYSLLKTGLEGPMPEALDSESRRTRTRFLPDKIHDAMRHFKSSEYVKELLGEENHSKYLDLKREAADRSPKLLGNRIKTDEILFHHQVTNQYLWGKF